jgi:hypothetical protein
MAFAEYWNNIKGTVPGLSAFLAQGFVNDAWEDIRKARSWSFLTVEGALKSPALINTGTVQVTQASSSVIANAAAKTVLDAVVLDALNPLVTRQFRVSSGPVYSISAYDDATGTITLDRPYLEASNSAAEYVVYRCYFRGPVTDFKSWRSIFDPNNGYSLKFHYTKEQLDMKDPTRGALGLAYRVAFNKVDSDGYSLWEFWPHPAQEQVFQIWYERKGADLVLPTDDIKFPVTRDLLLMRARYRAYEWAEANKGRSPELRGTDWKYLMSSYADDHKGKPNAYQTALARARKDDENLVCRNIIFKRGRSHRLGFPIDANFMQGHDTI